ncbi:SusC/RagA family TonB-linked outer membrane protein [Arcticibacter tournemirensis]|uniref:TonB-dependent receptor n=2 Tax=Pseudomonadati TaxID=3379134 RepID=A0A4Q0MG55_9SPHI|nr:TonB-dependent receptor [Arcticibacter tournemirensis]RXF72440.1 TonB-dependent receptor [Arcticibacter tournemirensis]
MNGFRLYCLRKDVICIFLLMFMLFAGKDGLGQQNETRQLTGNVKDENNDPLPGVSIKIEGTSQGTVTDAKGNYRLRVSGSPTLVFSFIGYTSQKIKPAGRGRIDVLLKPATGTALNEVVVVGFGVQKKATSTGAIASIDNKQLVQSPVANISNSLVGRLPGLVAVQQSGEPGFDQSKLKIRGIGTLNSGAESDPLIMVDGVQRNFNEIDPNEIENISILKDASATAVFGVRGANGVVLVTTKTGISGKPQVGYTSNFGLQHATSIPTMLSSFEYASLYNEAQKNGNANANPYFSERDLELYKNGSDPVFHPNVDWFDLVLKPYAFQQQHNFNIGGGNKDTRYFISLGYFDQNGSYNVQDVQKDYSANPRYQRYNVRSNFDIDFNKDFSASIKLGGQFANSNYPGQGAGEVFFRILSANPLMNPAVIDGKMISSVEGTPSTTGNPLAFIANSGYQNNFNSTLNTNISLQHKLNFITQGLKVRAMLSYDNYYQHWIKRNKTSKTYKVIKDPADPSKPIFVQDGEETPFSFSEGYSRWRKVYAEFATEYARSFGDHNITALALYNLERVFNPGTFYNNGSLDNYPVPRGYLGMVGRLTYNYKSKYLSEFNLGYNGSENFPEDKRYGFFPSFSLGWVVSEESFIPKNDFLTFLKIRGSLGEVGNDRIGGERFLYLPSVYNYGGGYNFGEVGSNYQWYGGSQEGKLGNPDVTWEKARKTNIGLESVFFKDRLRITADIFKEKRDNILAYLGTVPGLVQANLPPANIGKVSNEGYEVEAAYNNSVGKLSYWVKANYTFAKNKIVYQDEPVRAYPWLQRTGQQVGQYWGLVSDGFYNTQEELSGAIASAWTSELKLGDIRYKDINDDGIIDANDEVPIGNTNFPQNVYGFSFGGQIKGFDFSVLFQGASNVSTYISEMAAWAFDTEWRSANTTHLERWTPERYAAGESITYPRVELAPTQGKHNYHASDFWLEDASYLRLKNAEVAYRFSGGFLNRIGAKYLRLFVNGNNLITWSKMRNYDPEAPQGRGQFYPQMKTYNFGANLQF